MTAELDQRIHDLEQEFAKCRDTVGDKMVKLEIANAEKLTRLETQMLAILQSLNTYVSQHQFAPVRLIAYGLAGGVLMTTLGAILAKVLSA